MQIFLDLSSPSLRLCRVSPGGGCGSGVRRRQPTDHRVGALRVALGTRITGGSGARRRRPAAKGTHNLASSVSGRLGAPRRRSHCYPLAAAAEPGGEAEGSAGGQRGQRRMLPEVVTAHSVDGKLFTCYERFLLNSIGRREQVRPARSAEAPAPLTHLLTSKPPFSLGRPGPPRIPLLVGSLSRLDPPCSWRRVLPYPTVAPSFLMQQHISRIVDIKIFGNRRQQ